MWTVVVRGPGTTGPFEADTYTIESLDHVSVSDPPTDAPIKIVDRVMPRTPTGALTIAYRGGRKRLPQVVIYPPGRWHKIIITEEPEKED